MNDNQDVLKIENISEKSRIKNDFNVKLFTFKNEILFFCQNTWYKYNSISDKLEVENHFNSVFKNISDIIPIDDLTLYRELMKLELIVDKGRRLALSSLGKEVYNHLI